MFVGATPSRATVVRKANAAYRARKVSPVHPASAAMSVHRVIPGRRANPGRKGPKGLKVNEARKVNEVCEGPKVTRARKALKGREARRGEKGESARKEDPVNPDDRGLPGHGVSPVNETTHCLRTLALRNPAMSALRPSKTSNM